MDCDRCGDTVKEFLLGLGVPTVDAEKLAKADPADLANDDFVNGLGLGDTALSVLAMIRR